MRRGFLIILTNLKLASCLSAPPMDGITITRRSDPSRNAEMDVLSIGDQLGFIIR
jgi:hypothetical protein